jgi:hypothetical protein
VTSGSEVSRWRRALFHAIAATAALVAGELVWRLIVPEPDSARLAREYAARSLEFLSPCARIDRTSDPPRIVGQQPQNTGGAFSVPLEPAPGSTRIAIIGESTAVMLAGSLTDRLARDPTHSSFEILNCAESGSSLVHVSRRAAEVLEYHPDAVILAFGHNWLMPHRPISERPLRILLALSRGRLVWDLANMLGGGPADEAWPTPEEQLHTMEAWLTSLAGEAHARGIALILNTLASNLWFPPSMTRETLEAPEYLHAEEMYANGRQEGAIAEMESLLADRPEAYWHFVAGTWRARRGERELTRRHLTAARDRSRADPDRATSAVNEMIRAVAEREGLRLRDTERAMEEIAYWKIPGWDVMRDHCHLQPRYIDEEASALLGLAASSAGVEISFALAADEPRDDVLGWMLDGLGAIQGQLKELRAERYRRAIGTLVETWAVLDRPRIDRVIAGYLGSSAFLRLPEEERDAIRSEIDAGFAGAEMRTVSPRAH